MQYYNYDQNFLGFDSVSTQGWFVASRRELDIYWKTFYGQVETLFTKRFKTLDVIFLISFKYFAHDRLRKLRIELTPESFKLQNFDICHNLKAFLKT